MSATPYLSCTSSDDRVLIEVWQPEVVPPSTTWRVTRKERPGVNIPHRLVASAPYKDERAAVEAFDEIKSRIRKPIELIVTRKRTKR